MLREVDLTNRFNCQVIAIRKHEEPNYRYIPKADDELKEGDVVIVIGNRAALSEIEP